MATVNTESAPSSQVCLRDCESRRSDTSLTCRFNTHERADPEGAFMEPGPSFAPIGTEASVRPSFEMSRRREQSEPRTAFAYLSVRVNSGFIALPLYVRIRITTIRTVPLRPWLVRGLGLCAAAFLFASRPAFSMSQILSDTKQRNRAEADTEEGIQFAEAGNLAWAQLRALQDRGFSARQRRIRSGFCYGPRNGKETRRANIVLPASAENRSAGLGSSPVSCCLSLTLIWLRGGSAKSPNPS